MVRFLCSIFPRRGSAPAEPLRPRQPTRVSHFPGASGRRVVPIPMRAPDVLFTIGQDHRNVKVASAQQVMSRRGVFTTALALPAVVFSTRTTHRPR